MPRRGFTALLSLVLALSLEVTPLPGVVEPWRPPFLALAVIFWSMNQPGRYGVGIAWMLGLLLDVLQGAVLGQHALALTFTAYFTIKFCQRLRMYPISQQTIGVGILVGVHEFLMIWIEGMTGDLSGGLLRLAPVASAVLLWPPISLLLESAWARARRY